MRQELLREMARSCPGAAARLSPASSARNLVVSGNDAGTCLLLAGARLRRAVVALRRQRRQRSGSRAMLALWATPQGFVKAAMANKRDNQEGQRRTECRSLSAASTDDGILNAQNQVARVADVDRSTIVATCSSKPHTAGKGFRRVMFPSHIVRSRRLSSLDLRLPL